MIRVLAALPQLTDATAFYRGTYPLGKLCREGHIFLTLNHEWNWSTLCMGNILFMQRPFLDVHVSLVEMAKAQGCPVVIDYDDDFLSIPTDNPNYEVYSNTEIRKNITRLVDMADVVIVSTIALKERMKAIKPGVNTRVIPNATDFELVKRLSVPRKEPQNIVLWRGTNTHQRDLMTIEFELTETAQRNPTWKFYFLGYRPWNLMENMLPNQAVYVPGMDIFNYFKYLQGLQPQIMIVPLADNDFNRAKSNIAWQEGTIADAVVIAPSMQEWERPGVVNYHNEWMFLQALKAAMLGKRHGGIEKSRKDIEDNYDLNNTNAMRLEVFKELV